MRQDNSMKENESLNIRDIHDFRALIFYAISLFLALMLIIVSTTVMITVIYVFGSIRTYDFYLFLGIIGANLILSVFSLRGILITYSRTNSSVGKKNFVFVSPFAEAQSSKKVPMREKLTTEFFTENELEIIELLLKNNNRLLQSSLVRSMSLSRASISRALTSLENKGTIVKVRKGVTNEIVMSETYFK